jgi:hypothetical protein
MEGPFSLTNESIDRAVTRTSPGNYILSRDGRHANYVGRSDIDLNARLKKWVSNSYRWFWGEYASSGYAAFVRECELYHSYSGIDNQIHPQRPTGTPWKCPRCTIFD